MTEQSTKTVYVIDGARTPFLKAKGKPGPFSAADLMVAAGKPLLTRQPFSPEDLDEVIAGCVIPYADEVNIARVASLRLGCGHKVPSWTVQRNCGSGMQAIDSAVNRIRSGNSHLILAGGVEAMSRAPLQFSQNFASWLTEFRTARSLGRKARALFHLKLQMLRPEISLLKGLKDPIVDLSMGQTAENLAKQFDIERDEMDSYALRSHQRLAKAMDLSLLDEIVPLFDTRGNAHTNDDGVRRDSTLVKLNSLRPVFDKHFGQITAGNGAQVTDGAALLLLGDEETVKRYKLPVLGSIEDCAWAGVPPEKMGLGPVHATAELLNRNNLTLDDIDLWELNEAFAAQVLACLAALNDQHYCQENFNRQEPYGQIDQDRLNIDGGAISLGHPVGASGARIVLHLFHALKQYGGKYGIATLCIGGGQGGAMLLRLTNQ